MQLMCCIDVVERGDVRVLFLMDRCVEYIVFAFRFVFIKKKIKDFFIMLKLY